MKEKIMKEKELLATINNKLVDIKMFLIGNIPEENEISEMKSPECINDDLSIILEGLDYTLKQINIIDAYLKGGK